MPIPYKVKKYYAYYPSIDKVNATIMGWGSCIESGKTPGFFVHNIYGSIARCVLFE